MSEQVWVFLGAVALIVLQLVQARSTTRTVKDQFSKVTKHVNDAVGQANPEVQETNTLVKQLVDNQHTSARGYEIALQMVQEQNKQQSQQMMDLQRQNGEFKNRIDTYQGELDKLLTEQKERAKASRDNQDQITALTQKMTDMEETQARIADELQKAQTALADTQRELREQREIVLRLEGELRTEREEKARITVERDAALAKVKQLEERVAQLEQQVYDLEAKLGIGHTPILDPVTKAALIEALPPEIIDNARHTPPLGTPVLPVVDPFTASPFATTGDVQEATPK